MSVSLPEIAIRFALLSFVAVGGANALIPEVHAQMVTHLCWLTDRDFARLIVVAQAAPGPNMLFLPLVAWHVAGIPGALVGLLAFAAPSCTIAVIVARFVQRHGDHAVVAAVRRVLRPIAAGLILTSAIVLVQTIGSTLPPGISPVIAELVVVAVAAFIGTRTSINALWLLAAAGIAGAFYRF